MIFSPSRLAEAEREKNEIESAAEGRCVSFYLLVKNTNLLFRSLRAEEAHIIHQQKLVEELETGPSARLVELVREKMAFLDTRFDALGSSLDSLLEALSEAEKRRIE